MSLSVGDIVDLVGGNKAAADLAGVCVSAVSNWKAAGCIPARHSKLFERKAGRPLPAKLFSFKRKTGRNGTTFGMGDTSPVVNVCQGDDGAQ